MPIITNESDSTRKSIDVTVTPSATGVSVAGSVCWFDVLYTIPPVTIPCIYTDDAAYRIALCSTPPRLVLVEDDATPADEVCYLARWAFAKPADTCASVTIEVPKRVLVDRPPTVRDTPIMESYENPLLDEKDEPVLDEKGMPRTVTRQRQAVDAKTGEPRIDREIIPADPLPEPIVVQVSSTPVLPVLDAEETRGRKRRKRIKALIDDCRSMRDAGTTYGAMTAAEKAKVNELVALTLDIPMAVP